MADWGKHKFLIVQILKDIYSDLELSRYLGFKGGTALMLFYELPRFSVDLDFNLLDLDKSATVYNKVRNILLNYGRIRDEAAKFHGLILVLDYGSNERNLKIEISNRQFNDSYETKGFLGIQMKVMRLEDMFAHKLCALLDRNMLANRDIFDCYFFLQRRTQANKEIVEARMHVKFDTYLEKCIQTLEGIAGQSLLNGLGELMDDDLKKFVRSHLKQEVITLLKMYKDILL